MEKPSAASPKQQSHLELIDGVLDRKIASKSKHKKDKRKGVVVRKSSLIDDASEDVTSALMEDSEDPILGTMIGMPEKKKHEDAAWNELLEDQQPNKKAPGATAAGKKKVEFVPSEADSPPERRAVQLSCIVPGANGDPVLVGCTPPMMPSGVDVQKMFGQISRS